MPTFTYGETFADGDISDADKVARNLYNPQNVTPDSLDILNGMLDAANKSSSDNLSRRKFQPFTFARGHMVGATANLDFAEDRWWQGIDLTTGDPDQQFLPIPGGAIEYYQPWAATAVLLAYQISFGSDASSATTNTAVKLWTSSGGSHDASRRQAGVAVDAGIRYGKGSDQWITGHWLLLNESAGWKSASLRICSDAEFSRVRVRNFIAIPFR